MIDRASVLCALLTLIVVLAGSLTPAPDWMRAGLATAQSAAPPPNDNLANAAVISTSADFLGSNALATVETGEPQYPGDTSLGPYNQCYIIPGQIYTSTVWFKVSLPTAGALTVSTANPHTAIDSALAVYKLSNPANGASFANLSLLGCDNNGDATWPPGGTVPTFSSKLRVTAGAGDVYIQLAGIGGAPQGTYELTTQFAPDTFVADLGAISFEPPFNLVGWGTAQWQEGVSPNPFSGPSGDRSKRNHPGAVDASLTLSNLNPAHRYQLMTEVEDGSCDDSYTIVANGTTVFTYIDNLTDNEGTNTPVVVRAQSFVLPAGLVRPDGTLPLTFHNTAAATSGCTNPAVYNVQLAAVAAPPRIAYIYSTDLASRDAFSTYLQGRGYQVDQVPLANVTTTDFSPEKAIVVGDDTGSLGSWGTAAAITQIKNSAKPVVGVGEGGYAFFGKLSLLIGFGNGWHIGPPGETGAIVVDATNPVWSTPNNVGATTGTAVGLYSTASSLVAIFNPTPVAGVVRIGRQLDDPDHYPLISQGGCDVLWGFRGSPSTMTQQGKDLFENALQAPACSAGFTTISGVASCGDSGPLTGAEVDLFSGTSLVATTIADTVTAAYSFSVAPGSYTIRVIKGAIVCGGTGNTDGTTQLTSPIDLHNHSWLSAYRLDLGTGGATIPVDEHLFRQDQSAWFKFKVQPGSKVNLTLTNLPANYDLAVFKDISQAYKQLTSPQDLTRLGAEFAPDAYSPDAYSPDAYSPDAYSPDAYSPDAYSPDAFSPDAYSPDAYSPDAYSPDAYSPDAYSPDAYSPDAYSADAPLSSKLQADAFPGGEPISPDAYASAQTRSLLGVSAFNGTASEGIIKNTWDNDTDFYVRVRGRNGAFSLAAPFHLESTLLTGSCGPVAPITGGTTLIPVAGNFRTLILTDFSRLAGPNATDITNLQTQLAAFVARTEIAGTLVDVSADGRVAAARTQALAHKDCPYAENLLATEIKRIADGYRAVNAPLDQGGYIVLIGNDDVIPFFRYPDEAGLASEKGYVPPVLDISASQASLKLGYILGQDKYGTRNNVSRSDHTFPLADLAVGRLVETAADATALLAAYQSTKGGVVPTPTSALATGYDFIADDAAAIRDQFSAGLGAGGTVDSLIEAGGLPPTDPSAWTAEDLSKNLLGKRHDLIFLGGHFSAVSALAADYTTRLLSTDVLASPLDLTNAIIFSEGCHSGYNVVDGDAIPNVTLQPDYPQVFARKHATVIAGTGYQYGDTDFIEYGERLYLEFSKQLRTGTGAVAVGKALVAAKHAYLASTTKLSGIHEKTLIESTLYGLPMLSVNMPGARLPAATDGSVVTATNSYATNPGLFLGLTRADVTVNSNLTTNTVQLTDTSTHQLVSPPATYLSGSNGVVTYPEEPTLPLELRNVSAPGTVLRGVGFRGGTYTDTPNVRPMTGAAATELRSPHAPFFSGVLYPVRPWNVNYFDALSGGATRLMVTPSQFVSTSPELGTQRQFGSMNFRLFYSNNTATFGANTPGLSAAPSISHIAGVPQADPNPNVLFSVDVGGDPSAGVQEVWITYTAVSGPFAGQWQTLDLARVAPPFTQTNPSTRWTGLLALPTGQSATDVRYIVQAANGVGLVALGTNLGAYYVPQPDTVQPTSPKATTSLSFAVPPSATFREPVTLSATLLGNGQPLAGRTLVFGIGSQRRVVVTGPGGVATTTMTVAQTPGVYKATVSFQESADFLGSSASAPFTINKQGTTLALTPACTPVQATLRDQSGAQRLLRDQSVLFIVSGNGQTYATSVITDFLGRAPLSGLPSTFANGNYTVSAAFANGQVAVGGGSVTLSDERYQGSTISPAVPLTIGAQDTTVAYTGGTVIAVGTALNLSVTVASTTRDLTGALMCYSIKDVTGAVVALKSATAGTGFATSVSGLATGVYTVDAVLVGGNVAAGFFTSTGEASVAVFDPSGGFVTGGGWFNSPAGADPSAPTASGRADIAFVAKFLPGSTTPTGQTEFNLKNAGLSFKSTSYDWLVVSGGRAQFKGSGKINNAGTYTFVVTAVDGQLNGGADRVRIKITNAATGAVVYDSQMGAADTSDTADPVTPLGGGSIVIH